MKTEKEVQKMFNNYLEEQEQLNQKHMSSNTEKTYNEMSGNAQCLGVLRMVLNYWGKEPFNL